MTALDEIRQSFEQEAIKLGDYKNIKKIDLFNGYCDAEESKDEIKRNQYFAALMLIYWNKIYKWSLKCKSLNLEITDYVQWLYDCLMDTFYYKAWRNEILPNGQENEYYWRKDPASADRSMNFFCSTKCAKEYQKTNKDKRKSNYANVSIEEQIENAGDYTLEYLGCVNHPVIDGSKLIIQTLINKDKFIDALIIDGISNADSFKEKKAKDGTIVNQKFNRRKLVKHLNSIDEKFIITIFGKEYNVNDEKCKLIYSNLKSYNNAKLYREIDKIMIQIRNNADYLSCLK